MRRSYKAGLALLLAVSAPRVVDAFCGFYVAQADANLFNHSSKVVLVRDGNHTTLTMSNDYQGDPSKFAVVIPVPTVIEREAIQIADPANIDWVDQYSAPRMVEYWDPDPCPQPMRERRYEEDDMRPEASMAMPTPAPPASAPSLGVKVERTFVVGEYDIVILKATESTGLETWLHDNGYHVPSGAEAVLQTYIRQNMHFFVAKVDLGQKERSSDTFLHPIEVTYDSPKFMLPIRLGMANADGPQELFIYALTRKGRVETTNYRTTKIPTDENVPPYVQAKFGDFYKSMFGQQVARQGMSTVFLEYAWPLTQQCDPCSASMPTSAQLQALGGKWDAAVHQDYHGGTITEGYITRLHLRYDNAHFPEDLVFQETADQSTFQGRYVVNHPFTGDTTCAAGRTYEKTLYERETQEVGNLATLTGWNPNEIWTHVDKRPHPYKAPPAPAPTPKSWWDQQQ